MGRSSRKVYGSVQRLEKEGLVHTEKDIKGGRSILKVQVSCVVAGDRRKSLQNTAGYKLQFKASFIN
jgi:hypothetical protein